MRLAGILAQLAYRLSRQRFMQAPLDLVIVLGAGAVLLPGLVRLLVGGRWPLSFGLTVALLLWIGASLALRLRAFALFRPGGRLPPPGPGLAPYQKVSLRATGTFEVGGQRAYYVEAPGLLEATALGERILMVQIRPVSLLGLLASREEEWGWWYLFFRPEQVESPAPGWIHFGWRPRPALRLQRRGEARLLALLSFDDLAARDLVAADLRRAEGASSSRPGCMQGG